MRPFILLCVVVCFSITFAYAQEACPNIVQTALATVSTTCNATQRNQACYGNGQIDVVGRIDALKFETVGDIANITDIQTLTLSPMDVALGIWGVAYMNLQANLPDSLPGQGVTVIAFGDTQLENAIEPTVAVTATFNSNGRARKFPQADENPANIYVTIPSGTTVNVFGRNEADNWYVVELPTASIQGAVVGWVSDQVLTINGDSTALNVISETIFESSPADFSTVQGKTAPFSAFTFASAVGDSPCQAAPNSGIVVQTPKGAVQVNLTVNGVDITLGSTAYITAVERDMRVYLLEGKGIITANGVTQLVPAGTFTSIALDENGTKPSGEPTPPQPYDTDLQTTLSGFIATLVSAAPTTTTSFAAPGGSGTVTTTTSPITPIEVTAPLAESTIEQAIQDSFAPFGGLDGVYAFNRTNIETYVAPNYAGGFCNGGAESQSYTVELRFTENGLEMTSFGGNTRAQIASGVWGDPESKHLEGQAIPTNGIALIAQTWYANSLTSLTEKRTAAISEQGGTSACAGFYVGTWIAPLSP